MIKIALPWRSAPRRAADRRAGPLWEAAERSSREIRIERSRGKSRSREIKRNREKSGSREIEERCGKSVAVGGDRLETKK